MRSLDEFASAKLGELEAQQSTPRAAHVDTTRVTGIWLLRDGRRLLSFSCNDYLNLTHHPAVKEAAIEAMRVYGVGAGASRLVTGNHPAVRRAGGRLARLKNAQAACVFGSGYLANLGIIPALVGPDDLVLIDELAHACLWAGRGSRAQSWCFRHNDVGHGPLLAEQRGVTRALIATDGVFSMDGDLAPLAELAALAQRHDAWLMSDDAHGIGVVGGGRGSSFAHGKRPTSRCRWAPCPRRSAPMAAISAPRAAVIDLIRNRARTVIYSTGLPPAVVAAAIAALDLIEREPRYAALPLAKARAFTRRAGLPEAESPIVPVVLGEAEAALAASRLLEDHGFLVVAIRPPTVPAGTARLRLTFTAQHPDAEIERLADLVRTRVLALTRAASLFVTATGTDIGKTFVTAGLIRHLRAAGKPVAALKPVVSGFDPSGLAGRAIRRSCSRRLAGRDVGGDR